MKSEKGRQYSRNRKLNLRYGVTTKWWDKQFKKQKGCCEICGRHQSELGKTLNVDHNHETGAIRGLICTDCNFKLGQYENMDIIAIKQYLKKYKL